MEWITMLDFLWILFGELDACGRFRPIAWNLSYPDGGVYIKSDDRPLTEAWQPGDRMAYYPLTA
jgi:hypothetical protein